MPKKEPTKFKAAWSKAFINVALSDKRFDHDEDCIFFADRVECAKGCVAGPANDALNEIATSGGIILED